MTIIKEWVATVSPSKGFLITTIKWYKGLSSYKRDLKPVNWEIGQKIGESIDSSELKTLLAILLLAVGIAIAYDSFFAVHEVNEAISTNIDNLNSLSLFIKKLSIDWPIIYGLFSIIFAIALGVSAAFIRRFFSNLRKKHVKK